MSYQLTNGRFQAFNNAGDPLVGGTLYAYYSGTTNPQTTFTDAALTVPNANPVVLDARGEATVFLSSNAYTFTLKDANGVTIWSVDGIVDPGSSATAALAAFIASLASSIGASLLGFIQSLAGAVARTVQAVLRDRVSVKDFGALGDGATDDFAAITAAINAVSAGNTLYFPPGTYVHSGTLVFKNFINYKGAGIAATILKYTGAGGDGVQVNNPINSSTSALYSIEDMTLQVVNRTNGKANFADVGSAYVSLKRNRFTGAAMGIILDQSEHVAASECIIDNHTQTGVWLVNGPSHTVGAQANFTNRISFRDCQFNEASTCDCITDDGGHVHSYVDNNFNAGKTQIRLCAADAVTIASNEMEGSSSAAISLAATFSSFGGGAASGAGGPTRISSNMITTAGATAVTSVAGALTALTYDTNTFHLAAGGAAPDNLPLGINTLTAWGNRNPDGGTLPFNNLNTDTTFVPVLGGATTLGVGTYTTQVGRYAINGSICYFEIQLTWTAHTGTGQMVVSLLKAAVQNGPQFVPIDCASAGIALAAGASLAALLNLSTAPFGTTGAIQIYSASAGTLTGLAMAGSGTLYLSGSFRTLG